MLYFRGMERLVNKLNLTVESTKEARAAAQALLINAHNDVLRNYLKGKILVYDTLLIDLEAMQRIAHQTA